MKLQVAVAEAMLSDCVFLSFLLLHLICRNEDWNPDQFLIILPVFLKNSCHYVLHLLKIVLIIKTRSLTEMGIGPMMKVKDLIAYACDSLFSILLLVVSYIFNERL